MTGVQTCALPICFQRTETENGFEIFKVNGWDYPTLVETYEKAAQIARLEHVPVLIHVVELTQPQGHSTSGSHERYKNQVRLAWESEFDCLSKMRTWLVESNFASDEELLAIETQSKKHVLEAKKIAWNSFTNPVKEERNGLVELLSELEKSEVPNIVISETISELNAQIGRAHV